MFIFSLIVLILPVTQSNGFEFLEVPGDVHACVGGSAHFHWSYNDTKYDIQMIYWRVRPSGNTVLGHHFKPRDEIVYYSYGPERVEPLSGNDGNAGLLLKDIRATDEGTYTVELSGPRGAFGEAHLSVYTAAELTPTLQIDNRNVEFGQMSNVTSCKTCIVVVTTAHALPANINIYSSASESMCVRKTTCSMSLNWDGDRSQSVRITLEVDYGFCEKITKTFQVFWGNPATDSDSDDDYINEGTAKGNKGDKGKGDDGKDSVINTSLIIGIVIGVLVTIILLLVMFICLLYLRMKRKAKGGKDLSRRQDRFYTTVQRIRGKTPPISRGRHRHEVARSMSSPDPESHKLSLDDICGSRSSDSLQQRDRLLARQKNVDETDGKAGDDDEDQRLDPDGEDGPKIVDDPDDISRPPTSSQSTEEAREARESDDGTLSGPCSRLDSVDSSFVVVGRDPDGMEHVNFTKKSDQA